MTDQWDEDLTEEETVELLEKAEREIRKRRLEMPAIMALEMHKPLAGVASSALVVFAPFAVPFVGYDNVAGVSRLLRKRGNVERLIQRLECPRGEI